MVKFILFRIFYSYGLVRLSQLFFFYLIESLLYAFYHIYEVERPKHYFYLANKCNSFLVVSQGKSAMSRSY